jgi:predicted phage tail protein
LSLEKLKPKHKEQVLSAEEKRMQQHLHELAYLGISFVVVLAIMLIAFYKSGLVTSLTFTAGFFWLFVLPGFALMTYWSDKLGFVERFVVGTCVGAAVISIASYYLGLAGLHVKNHVYLLPIVFIVLGGVMHLWKGKKNKK